MTVLFADMFNGRYKDVFKHWAVDDPEDEVEVSFMITPFFWHERFCVPCEGVWHHAFKQLS